MIEIASTVVVGYSSSFDASAAACALGGDTNDWLCLVYSSLISMGTLLKRYDNMMGKQIVGGPWDTVLFF